MKIAVEGCAHGDLNKIYDEILRRQEISKIKVDLLICCGDFQSVRNQDDMLSMSVPAKYREMKDFHEYYNGRRKAPILTLFIGGNHESANYLWELPYGGWVAENIYYLGFAGVVNFAGLRIGGQTGIFKFPDYGKAHYEKPPFNENTKRSFYHVRSTDTAKLKLLSGNLLDIFLSHDWPKNIYNFGNKEQLMRFKPFLREEIESGTLGSNSAEDLLHVLKPKNWYSAHLHARFTALVPHKDGTSTKFLALDKCLPKRKFLEIIDFPDATDDLTIKHDPYWICVLKSTEQSSFKRSFALDLPEELKPSQFDVDKFIENHSDLTVSPFIKSPPGLNPQTEDFCQRFKLMNPCQPTKPSVIQSKAFIPTAALRKMDLPKPKMSLPKSKMDLPKPKMNLPKPASSDEFEEISRPSGLHIKSNDDDFTDLVNPNLSTSNPSEIDISSSSSDDDDNDDSDSNSGDKKKIIESNLFSSFIETPAHYKHEVVTISDSSTTDGTPSPTKKPKLIRRNQNLYTPSKDEE